MSLVDTLGDMSGRMSGAGTGSDLARQRWERERLAAQRSGLLTTRAAAELMGVTESKVRRWKALGLITDRGKGGKGHPALFDADEVRTAETRRVNLRARGECELDGCRSPHWAKGLCNRHYRADLRAQGRITPTPTTPERNAEATLQSGGAVSPPVNSPYRVIARTCRQCGDLLTTPPHLLRKDSGPLPRCQSCFLEAIKKNSRDRQAQTLERATNHGKQWTGPEMELVLRGDLSVRQLALKLGRTINAVRYIRRQLVEKQDPRYVKVAGMTPDLKRNP